MIAFSTISDYLLGAGIFVLFVIATLLGVIGIMMIFWGDRS